MSPRRAGIPKEVFLSHSGRDRRFVRKLVGVLRTHGIPVWYSEHSILGAQQWHDEIGAALSRCDWFVLVLSPDAVKSKWVKRELLYALQEDRYQDRIIPLLYRASDYSGLSWTLGSLERVDFSEEFGAGCRGLLRVWGIGYAPR
jgi:hypothetical protein